MRRFTHKNMNKSSKISIRPSALLPKRTSSTEMRVLPKKDIGLKTRYNHGREKDPDFPISERKLCKPINGNCKLGKSTSKTKLSNQGYTYGTVRIGEINDNNQPQVIQPFAKPSSISNPLVFHNERDDNEGSTKFSASYGLVNIVHQINDAGRKATLQDLLIVTEDSANHFPGQSNSMSKSQNGKQNGIEHFIVQKQMKKAGVKPFKVRHLSNLNSFDFDILNGKDEAHAHIEESRFPTGPAEVTEIAYPIVSDNCGPLSNSSSAEEVISSSSLGFHDANACFQENSQKSKTQVILPPHVNYLNRKGSTTNNDVPKLYDETTCAKNGCINCKNMLQKLKSQQLSYKNLQRQNGSLENCISQKRTLSDQLTKQVRYLIREYHQLARSAGIVPVLDEKSLSKVTSSTSILKSITDTSLTTGGIVTVAEILKTVRNETENEDSNPPPVDQNNNVPNANTEYVQDLQRQLSSLQETCNILQEQLLATSKDSTKNKRFLTDLLYTLNTRGYESITEHDGNEIDLRRCKGEQILVLKGKDNRQKAAQKKVAPQDLFMKAIIGSQERAIQTLLQQIDSQQRDSIVGNLLSSETVATGEPDGQRSAALEGEILSLVSLMEGACQRNADVFKALKDQYYSEVQARENAGVKSNTPVMEIVLERCQRIVTTKTPPRSRVRNKGDSPPPFQTPRSPVPQNRNRIIESNREISFPENIDQMKMKMALYESAEQNSANTFPDSRNLLGRSAYYPQNMTNSFGASGRATPAFGGITVGSGKPNGNDATSADMFNVRFNTNNRGQPSVELRDAEGLPRRNISASSLTNPFHMLPDEFDSYKYEMR